ncbi:hypothetical protein ACWD7C_32745 [Streptomyces sp. NPDC005134]
MRTRHTNPWLYGWHKIADQILESLASHYLRINDSWSACLGADAHEGE